MKHIKALLCVLACISLSTWANNDVDLEAVMKKMGHSYKLAYEASDNTSMQSHLDEFVDLVEQAKQASFYKAPEQSQQGLDEVLAYSHQAQERAQKGDLEGAKQALQEIDSLRKKYHELHEPPSFWDMLFGQ